MTTHCICDECQVRAFIERKNQQRIKKEYLELRRFLEDALK